MSPAVHAEPPSPAIDPKGNTVAHFCQDPQDLWVELETSYLVQVRASNPQSPDGREWDDCGTCETTSAMNADRWLNEARTAHPDAPPEDFRIIESAHIRRLIHPAELAARAGLENSDPGGAP